jgi:hypothetical protein
MAVFLAGPTELKSERRGWHSKFTAEVLGNASSEGAAVRLTLVTGSSGFGLIPLLRMPRCMNALVAALTVITDSLLKS